MRVVSTISLRVAGSSTRAATRAVMKRGLCITPEVQATLLALHAQQRTFSTSTSIHSSSAAASLCSTVASSFQPAQLALSGTPCASPAMRFAGTTTTTGTAVGIPATRASFTSGAQLYPRRAFHGGIGRPSNVLFSSKKGGSNSLQGVSSVERYKGEEEEERKEEQEEDPFSRNSGPGYLPFPPPFHTINIIMLLLIANVMSYFIMMWGSDDVKDFIIDHFTLSYDNAWRIYPMFTNALYQENLLQLLIDCWLLWQFGDTMLGFLGNGRMTFLVLLCSLGSSFIHLARQKFELHYGMDELEVRGRCYGPNPFIMGLISIEGLIFRHLNFIQQPPIPFLVLTAFVMVLDVWRIFTTQPEEHGAATGGALMAYFFWALPIRFLGLDKLTATM